jgi:hypothetical protein
MTERVTLTTDDAGCYLDSHRGHYAIRDLVWLAETAFGYRVDADDSAMLAAYEEHSHEEEFPIESLHDLADCVENWLNGQHYDFQPEPPIIPDGYAWGWYEGDFGLYPIEDDDGY